MLNPTTPAIADQRDAMLRTNAIRTEFHQQLESLNRQFSELYQTQLAPTLRDLHTYRSTHPDDHEAQYVQTIIDGLFTRKHDSELEALTEPKPGSTDDPQLIRQQKNELRNAWLQLNLDLVDTYAKDHFPAMLEANQTTYNAEFAALFQKVKVGMQAIVSGMR